MKMSHSHLLYERHSVDELDANYGTVSRNKCGFFLCSRGNADILLNNRSYCLAEGGLCLYTPYSFIRIIRHSADIDGYLLEGDWELFAAALSGIAVEDRLFIRRHPCISLHPEESRHIAQSVEMLDAHHERMQRATSVRAARLLRQAGQHLMQAFALSIIEVYFSSLPVEERPQGTGERIFNAFLMAVHRHCEAERTVLFYADALHLSPNYLSAVVRVASGHPAIRWIATITMVHAQHYLTSTRLSIKEIAECMHFPDQSSFGRYFRHNCGISPLEYRRRMQE